MKLCSDRGTDGKCLKNLAGSAEGKESAQDLGIEGKLIFKCVFLQTSNPAEAVGFLRAKISSACLPSEGK
jgi:hypothetical protein